MTIIWEEPPRRNGSQQLADLCQQLREKPTEWGRLHDFDDIKLARVVASRLRTGKIAGVDKGSFEFTASKLDEGAAVWGRFLP